MAKEMLIRKEQGTLVVRDEAAEVMRAQLRRKLPSPVYRALKSTPKKFYGAMFNRSR